jgi:DNA-binding IclR family transcriptional regulator
MSTADDRNRDRRSVTPSPPTDRVVAVMEFLAARPGEPATVAELVGHLGLNRATCDAILSSLVRAGWVVRDGFPRTFSPGPALIALGQAAEFGVPASRAADGELAALAADLGMPATTSYPSGDRLVIGSRRPVETAGPGEVRVGQSFPFAPPFGPGLVAWGPEKDIDRWLARAPRSGPADITRFRDAVATVRRRGWTTVSMSPLAWRLRAVLTDLDALSARRHPGATDLLHEIGAMELLDEELDDGRTHPVSIMAAPAFGRDGTAALNISVHVWRELAPADIRAVGDRLLVAAHAVTAELRGRTPEGFPRPSSA